MALCLGSTFYSETSFATSTAMQTQLHAKVVASTSCSGDSSSGSAGQLSPPVGPPVTFGYPMRTYSVSVYATQLQKFAWSGYFSPLEQMSEFASR